MLLVLSFLLTPISLCYAVYRLIHIPLRFGSGQLCLDARRSVVPGVLAWAAYGVLLGCTVGLCGGLIRAWVVHLADVSEIVRLVVYFEAYPAVLVMAEWRFFYGFHKVGRQVLRVDRAQEVFPVPSH